MAAIVFHHPLLPHDLHISVKPDQVKWAYGLNTSVYPTYGGEVVQILSVYFDDMTIAGTVSTVKEMEQIYGWFITYMQYATQGRNNPSFDHRPVSFHYPERNWHFQIWPKALPGFAYGRDIVAPTWTLTAAVKEPDATFAEQIKDYAAFQHTTGKALAKEGFSTFGTVTADFGKTGDLINNPFASPNADPSRNGETVMQFLQKQAQQLGDTFDGFVQAYQNNEITTLPQFSSQKPQRGASPSPTNPTPSSGNVTAITGKPSTGTGRQKFQS